MVPGMKESLPSTLDAEESVNSKTEITQIEH